MRRLSSFIEELVIAHDIVKCKIIGNKDLDKSENYTSSLFTITYYLIDKSLSKLVEFCLWAMKKIFLMFLCMNSNSRKIKAKPCISSIPQEMHITNTKCCISSSRR